MAIYSVLEPPDTGDTRFEKAVVIKEGFSVIALIAPLLWFLWHRMWLEALAIFIVSAGLGALGMIPGLEVVPILGILVSVFAGLEARNLRAGSFRRHGWKDWGVVVASSHGEAELRYMTEALANRNEGRSAITPVITSGETKIAPTRSVPTAKAPAFGLIDYPRRG